MKSASDWTNSSLASDNLHPSETTGRTICENENGLWSVCQEENLTVFAAPLKHRIECFGYVIQEKQHPGKLDPNLLKQKGIPPGPLYSKIKNGEAITAPDGSIVMPDHVLGPPRRGRKVVLLGDTCDSSRIVDIACDADVVVHEATLEDELKETCIDHGHSTPGNFLVINILYIAANGVQIYLSYVHFDQSFPMIHLSANKVIAQQNHVMENFMSLVQQKNKEHLICKDTLYLPFLIKLSKESQQAEIVSSTKIT